MDNRHDAVKQELGNHFSTGAAALPPLPPNSQRLRHWSASEAPQPAQTDQLLRHDPLLESRLQHFAALHLRHHPDDEADLSELVAQLGPQHLGHLVLALELCCPSEIREPRLQKVLNKRWALSLRRAALSAGLAQHVPHLDSVDALLAGLVQDIGCHPLLEELQHWPQVSRLECDLQRLCDQLSAELGAMLLSAWQLEPALVDCARLRRDWCRQHKGPADLADVVQVADQLLEEPRDDDRLARLPAFQRLLLPPPRELRPELAESVALWLKLLGGRPNEVD
ncbi:HDOD domain-containing protein [Metapseudomonas boanensis]|uniref:HDOD domain-containing protein n=1 Tax=Metapseudomonas boanensis TaxID=2822138 RepID=A0ABS5XGL5_9GAMM|nr:HDOD domain-containing protein [Pseudomonas boanensis]MBT8766831.1 HDOD domain-containing protein [Pseudomonas boanensis]